MSADPELAPGASLALLAGHIAMEEIADYVRRGRRFARTPPRRLDDLWAGAFRAWAADIDDVGAMALCSDLDAELVLRRRRPPERRVEAERASVGRELERRYARARANPAVKVEMEKRFRSACAAFARAVEEGMGRGN